MQLPSNYLGDLRRVVGEHSCVDAEYARVAVTLVEGLAEVDPVMSVQDVLVQSREHSFAGTALGERRAAKEEGVHHCDRVLGRISV